MPPARVFDAPGQPVFVPAPELLAWARATFIDEGSELENEEHAHLRSSDIGMLWTNVENARRGRRIVGQCEMGLPPGGKWSRAKVERQLLDWFGLVPDFVITIDAEYAAESSDATFCALIEHELLHAGQERDEFGQPKFSKMTGEPIFALRGHDLEEFISVARRYGGAASGIGELIEATKAGPTIAAAHISQACGTCLARAA